MMKCSVFLSIKWTPTFDSFSVNKPTACWSVVRCCQLYTDNVNTCEFVTSVVYVFKYVCMHVMSACIPTQKTIHSLPHWGIQYKCWIVYYNKEILIITVNEQHKKKIQVFLDVMPWLAKCHQCHASWTAWPLKFHQQHIITSQKTRLFNSSVGTEHLNPLHAGWAIGWPNGLFAHCINRPSISLPFK